VANQLVTFHVTSGGGSTFSGASLTNADGIAQDRWTLGLHTADAQQLEARAVDNVTGAAIVFATFSATPLPDVPASLQVFSGNGQVAAAGHTLPQPCVVTLADQHGNPNPGVAIGWTVTAGRGLASPASPTTDADGRAAASWTLGANQGVQTLQAAGGGFTVSFQATGLASSPASLAIAGGDGQSAPVSTRVPKPPVVVVHDGGGSPVAGVPVSFLIRLAYQLEEARPWRDRLAPFSYPRLFEP
jgi:hypothetical protein